MKDKPKHILARVRSLLGKTQAQVGVLVGLSEDTIKSIELRRRSLSEESAQRLSAMTGVSFVQLMEGFGGRLLTKDGSPFTRQTYEKWRKEPESTQLQNEAHPSEPKPLTSGDIADVISLCEKLRVRALAEYISQHLSEETRDLLLCRDERMQLLLKRALAADLDKMIKNKSFYDPQRFREIRLSPETETRVRKLNRLPPMDLRVLNRNLLEDAFPQEIRKARPRTAADRIEDHSNNLREVAMCMLLAATLVEEKKGDAVFSAMLRALEGVRQDFGLEGQYWKEWMERNEKLRFLERPDASGKKKPKQMIETRFEPNMLKSRDPTAQEMLGLMVMDVSQADWEAFEHTLSTDSQGTKTAKRVKKGRGSQSALASDQ